MKCLYVNGEEAMRIDMDVLFPEDKMTSELDWMQSKFLDFFVAFIGEYIQTMAETIDPGCYDRTYDEIMDNAPNYRDGYEHLFELPEELSGQLTIEEDFVESIFAHNHRIAEYRSTLPEDDQKKIKEILSQERRYKDDADEKAADAFMDYVWIEDSHYLGKSREI